jgi:hypothetical protein
MMQPFDLILFKGSDFVGSAIRLVERFELGTGADAVSHVGLLIDRTVCNDKRLQWGKWYIFESTCSGPLADGVPNIDGRSFLGTQIRDLELVIKACKGQVFHAALKSECRARLPDAKRTTKIIHRLEGIRYDANPVSLCSSLFPWCRCCRGSAEKLAGTEDWLFCSELVALVMKRAGIFSADVEPKDIVPADFLPLIKDTDCVPKIYLIPTLISCPETTPLLSVPATQKHL